MLTAKLFVLLFLAFVADAQFRRQPPQRPKPPRPRPAPAVSETNTEIEPHLLIGDPSNTASVEGDYGTKNPQPPQNITHNPRKHQPSPTPKQPILTTKAPPLFPDLNSAGSGEETTNPEVIIVYPENSNPPTRNPLPGRYNPNTRPNYTPDPILEPQPEQESEQVSEPKEELMPEVKPELEYEPEETFETEEQPIPEFDPELEIEPEETFEPEGEPIPEFETDKTFEPESELEPEPQPDLELEPEPELTDNDFLTPSEIIIFPEEEEELITNPPNIEETPISVSEPPEPVPTRVTAPVVEDEFYTESTSPSTTTAPLPASTKSPRPPSSQLPIGLPNKIPSRTNNTYLPNPNKSRQILDYKCKKSNDYYPFSKECDTYIECKQNVARKYFCPDGLVFNPKVSWPEYPCAYPTEVRCYNKTIIQRPDPTGECPRRFGFFPDRQGDCTKYIVCQNGHAYRMACPSGLAFHPIGSGCTWPENVPSCNLTLKPAPSKNCPRRYGTFPDQNGDCTKYFVCQDGRANRMTCPRGLAFNPKFSACDWPENVPDCNPRIFEGFTCPAPTKDVFGRTSEQILKYRYKDNCKYYIACLKGEPRLLQCDAGLSFDESLGYCVNSDLVPNCKGIKQ